MILLASWATGFASSLFPPVNIEAYLVGLTALHGGPLLWLAVLAVTAGHMAGKLLFYALGRGWLRRGVTRSMSRHHPDQQLPVVPAPRSPEPATAPALAGTPAAPRDAAAGGNVAVGSAAADPALPVGRGRLVRLRARLAAWSGLHRVEQVAGRPWATAVLCFASSCVGVPPFAVVAVLLGRFRMPVLAFLLVGGVGRLARFAAVAGLSGAVLG